MQGPNSDPEHLIVNTKQMIEIENQIISSGLPVEALMEKVGLKMSNWFLNQSELIKN